MVTRDEDINEYNAKNECNEILNKEVDDVLFNQRSFNTLLFRGCQFNMKNKELKWQKKKR